MLIILIVQLILCREQQQALPGPLPSSEGWSLSVRSPVIAACRLPICSSPLLLTSEPSVSVLGVRPAPTPATVRTLVSPPLEPAEPLWNEGSPCCVSSALGCHRYSYVFWRFLPIPFA